MENKVLKLKSELTKELQDNILMYWINHVIDEKNGGFIGHIDYPNLPKYDAPKGSVLNARILWTFSSAYRVFPNEKYLQAAERAYQYIKTYFVDREFGGVYWELDYLGKPLNSRKQIYAISFTIYGLAEYYMISNDNESLELAKQLFDVIEKYSFDQKRNGYVEALSHKWEPLQDFRLSEKDANESKTMNTHLHILEAYANLYRVWKDERLQKALRNLIELFINKFINQNHNLNLFFDDDWTLKSDEISFGHDIECSWLLHEAAEVLANQTLLHKVEKVAVNMANETFKGIDEDFGLFNESFPSENKIDSDKHWWPQAEAIVGFYNAYQISGDEKFLDQALNSWEFTKNYIVDKEHGEWFGKVNKDGKPYLKDEKVGFWKCPYHNGRACIELIRRIK